MVRFPERITRHIQAVPVAIHCLVLSKPIRMAQHLDCHIGIGRFVSQSPKGMLVAPDWGLKNYEFVAMLEKALARRDVRQGMHCLSAIG